MIYSEKHNFIFIHIVKTGGQSLYSALAQYSEPRQKTIGEKLKGLMPFPCGLKYFPPHAPADWVRRRIGRETFDRAYSFAVVRNPFDRLVSQYEYIRQSPNHHRHLWIRQLSFSDYVDELSKWRRDMSQSAMVCDKTGKILVSEIFRFENFEGILPEVCSRIGLDEIPLRHRNKSARRSVSHYYDAVVEEKVRRIFHRDFEIFNYPNYVVEQ